MEELRSTEILDAEIKSDARKKAARIIKDAEKECASVYTTMAERLVVEQKERTNFYAEKLALFEKDASASLPLNKQRSFVLVIDTAVKNAMSAYVSALPESKKLLILMNRLKQYKPLLAGKKVKAFVTGFAVDTCKKALDTELGNSLLSCVEDDSPLATSGIMLFTDDGKTKYRLTISEIENEIQERYRAELVAALFGGIN